jgi:hypothetical protein
MTVKSSLARVLHDAVEVAGEVTLEYGLDAGKPRGKSVMSHARQGGQSPDQANSGRQTGVAAHARTIHSQGTQTRPDAR